ncbi:hypothetical protein T552_00270 [Pneumocystis carinii B80]|uniref:Uncharacterized protein n=1 Tax=Pneumocystis carinii (strain B80) TaxID=1408658 RepID=A0A0W4ZTB9_PNEC8|nr:hypothetical protein T552_00270 [Pneumocystis carinii B80]KTW31631.1 hypothetical protein T552_00270 [Pneumocystis carinii B80]
MGAIAVRIFRTVLPLIIISLTLVSVSLTIFAGVRRDPYLDKNYVFKIDATQFAGQKDLYSGSGSTPANKIGLANHYYVFLWNHCESNKDMKFMYCSKPRFDYYFNSVKLLKARLRRDARVRIPSGSDSYHKRLRVTSYCSLALLLLGMITSLATFVFVIIITLAGSSAVFTSTLSGVSTLFLILGSSLLTAQYLELSNLIRDKAGYLKVKGEEGIGGLFFLWFSSALSVLSFISLLLATRFIRKKKEAAKLYH